MRWEKKWYEMKNKFFHPPARTSFLSMLLLFPYFLCCPPSPPCRAALHAGACWPWRPTRYCQPTFPHSLLWLTDFLTEGCTLHERSPSSSSSSSPASSRSINFSNFTDNSRDNQDYEYSKTPCNYLGLDTIDWLQFIIFWLLFFQARKR